MAFRSEKEVVPAGRQDLVDEDYDKDIDNMPSAELAPGKKHKKLTPLAISLLSLAVAAGVGGVISLAVLLANANKSKTNPEDSPFVPVDPGNRSQRRDHTRGGGSERMNTASRTRVRAAFVNSHSNGSHATTGNDTAGRQVTDQHSQISSRQNTSDRPPQSNEDFPFPERLPAEPGYARCWALHDELGADWCTFDPAQFNEQCLGPNPDSCSARRCCKASEDGFGKMPIGVKSLRGVDLMDGNWGDSLRLMRTMAKPENSTVKKIITAYADNSPNKKQNCYLNSEPTKWDDDFCRTHRMRMESGEKFFTSFLETVFKEVVGRQYPQSRENEHGVKEIQTERRPIPRFGNHAVRWYTNQTYLTLFGVLLLDHTQPKYFDWLIDYFETRTNLITSDRSKARLFLIQMITLESALFRAFRISDGDKLKMDSLETVDEAELRRTEFLFGPTKADLLSSYTARALPAVNAVSFLFLRETASMLGFGRELFPCDESHKAFLKEFTDSLTHSYEFTEEDEKSRPKDFNGCKYTGDSYLGFQRDSRLLNFPNEFTTPASTGPDHANRAAGGLIATLWYSGHAFGHLRPDCRFDHFSPQFGTLSESYNRIALNILFSGTSDAEIAAGKGSKKNLPEGGKNFRFWVPDGSGKDAIRKAYSSLTTLAVHMLHEGGQFGFGSPGTKVTLPRAKEIENIMTEKENNPPKGVECGKGGKISKSKQMGGILVNEYGGTQSGDNEKSSNPYVPVVNQWSESDDALEEWGHKKMPPLWIKKVMDWPSACSVWEPALQRMITLEKKNGNEEDEKLYTVLMHKMAQVMGIKPGQTVNHENVCGNPKSEDISHSKRGDLGLWKWKPYKFSGVLGYTGDHL